MNEHWFFFVTKRWHGLFLRTYEVFLQIHFSFSWIWITLCIRFLSLLKELVSWSVFYEHFSIGLESSQSRWTLFSMSCMIFEVEGFVVGYSKILPPLHNYTSELHNHAGFDKFDITKLQSRLQADLFGTDLMELKVLRLWSGPRRTSRWTHGTWSPKVLWWSLTSTFTLNSCSSFQGR